MSMYAVKNDDGKYLFGHHQWGKPGQIILTYSNITSAKSDAKTYGGHVVELVEKPKRWNVKVPHVSVGWYFITNDGNLSATYQPAGAGQFTVAEIEHYGLQDCEKMEVTE